MLQAELVLSGAKPWSLDVGDCLVWLKQLPASCVNLVFFSPPYEDARTYGIDFKAKGQTWVDWIRPIIVECCRVSSGLTCINMAAKVEQGSYTAAVEWLVADLTRLDGLICGPSPHAWVKSEDFDDAPGNGTPGSGGPRYQRRDWEPIYSFCLPDRLPLTGTDNTAFGRPPQYRAGGEFSNRNQDGSRVNEDPWEKRGRSQTVPSHNAPGPSRRADGKLKNVSRNTKRRASGALEVQTYIPPKISNPGNVICSDVLRVPVGGGKLGCPIAHTGEAPMALHVAERFVRWYCPPDGIVLDPFCGTGTTGHAALQWRRRFIGCDLRLSQVELSTRRLSGIIPMLFE